MSGFASRQPLVLRAALVLIGVGLLRLAAWAGWLPPELVSAGPVDVERVIDLVMVAWGWWSTHRVVTPVADPRDHFGRPLAPTR